MSKHDNDVETMVDYMLICIKKGDWHGVSDAANDIRVMEAEEKGRSDVPAMPVMPPMPIISN